MMELSLVQMVIYGTGIFRKKQINEIPGSQADRCLVVTAVRSITPKISEW
jgi:hypothetical protein